MGVFSSPGPGRQRPGRRSIRVTFAAMLRAPVVCLVLLWSLALAAAVSGSLPGHAFTLKSHRDVVELALFAGASLVIIVSAVIMGRFADRLSRELSGLEATARHLAEEQLPQLVAR